MIDSSVPLLVRRCIEYMIIKNTVSVEGIFRVPGSHKEMTDLRAAFERGSPLPGTPARRADLLQAWM